MRKTITTCIGSVMVFLCSYGQEKIIITLPSDSIPNIEDSVIQLPLVQLRMNLFSTNFGKYYNQPYSYTLKANLDVSLNLNYGKWMADLNFCTTTKGNTNLHPAFFLDNNFRFQDCRLNVGYRFFIRSAKNLSRVKIKINNPDSLHISSYVQKLTTNVFHQVYFLGGITRVNYHYPEIVSCTYINTMVDYYGREYDNYDFCYFFGSKQNLVNLGLNYRRTKTLRVTTKSAKGYKLSNLNVYAYASWLISDKSNFLTLKNARESYPYYSDSTEANYSFYYYDGITQRIDQSSQIDNQSKLIQAKKAGFRAGFDFQFSKQNSFFSWNTGFEVGLNSGYQINYVESINPQKSYLSHQFPVSHGSHALYYKLRLGILLHFKNWKE